MRDYELTFLLSADLDEKGLNKEVKVVSDQVTKLGAKLKKNADPVKRNLAYRIDKVNEAYYVFFELTMEPAEADKIDAELRVSDSIVRYLLINKEK